MSKNLFITCKESRIENNRSFYGCFHIGPFDAGQSLTVANALRRTLLSDCPGLGIISVTIENVSHEYSTLPGMRESVLDLLLNLKEIVLKKKKNAYASFYSSDNLELLPLAFDRRSSQRRSSAFDFAEGEDFINSYSDSYGSKQKQEKQEKQEKQRQEDNDNIVKKIGASFFKPVSGFLKIKGPGVVRAKDLKLPPFIECVDPEQYIATLAEDGFLCMKFIIMEGKGYFIQKNDTYLDNKIVKNRTNFLNQLKKLKNPTLQKEGAFAFAKAKVKGIKEESKKEQQEQTELLYKEKIKESNPLNLDTIFNPVTKISYLIEDFDNKISDDSNKRLDFLNDICSLIESSNYLKQNLPFLTNEISPLLSTSNPQIGADSSSDYIGIGLGGENLSKNHISSPLLLQSQKQSQKQSQTQDRRLDFSKFIETYTTSEIQQLSNSLQPLKKQSSLHVIVLEIWTNGSLHPREALSMAFKNLASVFLNLQKTKLYSSLYINESSYQRSFNDLSPSIAFSQRGKDSSMEPKGSEQTSLVPTVRVPFPEGKGKGEGKEEENAKSLAFTFTKAKVDKGIENLNIPLRPYTLLKRANINKISDLCSLTIDDLESIFTNTDKRYVKMIVNEVKKLHLH